MSKIDEGNVRSVEIMGSEVKGQFKDNTIFRDATTFGTTLIL